MNPDFVDLLRSLRAADVRFLVVRPHVRGSVADIEAEFAEGVRCPVIGLDALIANKRASGSPQDLADIAALEKLRAALNKRR